MVDSDALAKKDLLEMEFHVTNRTTRILMLVETHILIKIMT